jgi:hypothetical protein
MVLDAMVAGVQVVLEVMDHRGATVVKEDMQDVAVALLVVVAVVLVVLSTMVLVHMATSGL